MLEAGMISASVYPVPSRTAEQSIAIADELVERLRAGTYSDELLAAVVRNYRLELDRAPVTNTARVARMEAAAADDRGWAYELERSKRVAAITKQDLVRVAKQYLTRNRLVLLGEVGRFEMPAVQRPKVTPPKPKPNARSAYATQLLAEPFVKIPPMFVHEGTEYEVRDTPVGPLTAVRNTSDDTYAMRFTWDVGERHLPLVCAAIHALGQAGTGEVDAAALRTTWFGRAQVVDQGCFDQGVIIEISGVDGTFDASWAELERWLSGNGIDDAVWKRAAPEVPQLRAQSYSQLLSTVLADYAVYGKASSFLTSPSTAQVSRATAAEIRQTLQTLLGMRRAIWYYGPRSPESIQLPPTLSTTRPPPPRTSPRMLEQKGTRIVTLDTGANRSVTTTITLGLGPLDVDRRAAANVFASYLSNSVLSEVSAFAFVPNEPIGSDGTLQIQFSIPADQLVTTLERALAILRNPAIDPAFADQARLRIEETMRAEWLGQRALMSHLAMWHRLGYQGDPREAAYKSVQRTRAPQLTKFASDIARAPTYIGISGDISAIDRPKLAKLGTIETATTATISAP
jgi:hypothetical protein